MITWLTLNYSGLTRAWSIVKVLATPPLWNGLMTLCLSCQSTEIQFLDDILLSLILLFLYVHCPDNSREGHWFNHLTPQNLEIMYKCTAVAEWEGIQGWVHPMTSSYYWWPILWKSVKQKKPLEIKCSFHSLL